MSRALSESERILGPRPQMTLVVEDDRVVEIWVAGRAPRIAIRDYDWGRTDSAPAFDREGFPYSDIHWSGPAWALGLSLYPPEKEPPMAQPELTHIPLDQLSVSKLNKYNTERPHEGLDMATPAEVYTPSARIYEGLPEIDYPFHDREVLITACGRICMHRKKINISTVLAGQRVGIKEVDDGIWLGTFMHYDLGYIDLEQRTLQTINNPFGANV